MLKITSRDNQRVKHARAVREGSTKDAIFVEGLRLAEEALRSDLKIFDVLISESFAVSESGQAFLQNFQYSNFALVIDKIFDSLSDTKTSQGIILICEKPATGKILIENILSKKESLPIVVLLHKINNPSNLGAILRTCEAVNVAGMILTRDSADAFSPKSLRGAMGAVFRIPLWIKVDFYEVLEWAKEKNLTSICADAHAKKSYLDTNWKRPKLLIFGSEAQGLSIEEKAKVNESLLIPMENKVESLNLAVSCGIILFEAKRQIESQ